MHSALSLLELIQVIDQVSVINNQIPVRLEGLSMELPVSPYEIIYPMLDFKSVITNLMNTLQDLYGDNNCTNFCISQDLLKAYNEQIKRYLQCLAVENRNIASCHGRNPVRLKPNDVVFFVRNNEWKLAQILKIEANNMATILFICNQSKKRMEISTHVRVLKYFFSPNDNSEI